MPGRAAALAEALPQAGRGQAQRADLTVRGLVGGGFWGLGEVWAGEKGGGGGRLGEVLGGFWVRVFEVCTTREGGNTLGLELRRCRLHFSPAPAAVLRQELGAAGATSPAFSRCLSVGFRI